MLTLKQLRAEVRRRLPMIDGVVIRNADVDRAINKAYRELVKQGELLKESALSCGVDDQERYDLTSSTIWLPDSGVTDSTATINEGATFSSTDTTLTVSDGTVFSAGQLIKMDDEVCYISSISTNDLTIIRGVANTTAATHSDGTTIYVGSKPAILKLIRVDWNKYQIEPISLQDIANVDVT